MSALAFFKQYWRIVLLVVLLVVSAYALFVPGGVFGEDPMTAADADEEGDEVEAGSDWHNLVFGLGLDGGARISAPPIGMTAEGLEMDYSEGEESDAANDLRTDVLADLDLEPADVSVRFDVDEAGTGTFTAEVFTDNVTAEEVAAAIDDAERDVTVEGDSVTEDDIEDGVTAETRDEMVDVIETKINEAGLAGGRAYDSEQLGGQHYVTTEAPAMTAGELQNLLEERGVVEVWAYYPDEDGEQVNETVLERDHITSVDPPEYSDERRQYEVGVRVDDTYAPEYQQRMNDLGFTTEGQGQCHVHNPETGEFEFDQEQDQWCLLTVSDDEVVSAHNMGDLAEGMRAETWADDPSFVMTSQSQADAQSLAVNLRAGHLPAPLDLSPESAQVFSVQPALADQFKQYSLFIGLLSVVTVSGVVYLRYTDVRVATPMILTAMAEVVILLGFAAAIRMPLDLAHVAGFIAVIGTGVDDLVIIADEVMHEGNVEQRRVFDSRFKKAFWVIGAAAATTIIAMSPLAVLSLGDLQGFAIVTILGVLVGVLVTRPAYGDILRILMTDEK